MGSSRESDSATTVHWPRSLLIDFMGNGGWSSAAESPSNRSVDRLRATPARPSRMQAGIAQRAQGGRPGREALGVAASGSIVIVAVVVGWPIGGLRHAEGRAALGPGSSQSGGPDAPGQVMMWRCDVRAAGVAIRRRPGQCGLKCPMQGVHDTTSAADRRPGPGLGPRRPPATGPRAAPRPGPTQSPPAGIPHGHAGAATLDVAAAPPPAAIAAASTRAVWRRLRWSSPCWPAPPGSATGSPRGSGPCWRRGGSRPSRWPACRWPWATGWAATPSWTRGSPPAPAPWTGSSATTSTR